MVDPNQPAETASVLIDDFEVEQARAREEVMRANTDPSLLTATEHARISRLQAHAAHAATEANLVLLDSPRNDQSIPGAQDVSTGTHG